MAKAKTSPAHTEGNWFPYFHSEGSTWSVHASRNRGMIDFDFELAEMLFKGKEAEANARLMAAAPELLKLARNFKSVCEDRLEALKEENDEPDRSKEAQEMIDHYSLLLMDCNEAIAKAAGKYH